MIAAPTAGKASLLAELTSIVGPRHLLSTPSAMRRYERGYRYGQGHTLAVVRPASLTDLWRVLQVASPRGVIRLEC